jgi:homoserine kinase type II
VCEERPRSPGKISLAWQKEGEPVSVTEEEVIRAAGAWGLDAEGIRDDLAVSGSPRRSEFRCVVECPGRRLVVLECIRGPDRSRKQAIIDRLDLLSGEGLSCVHPYLRTAGGAHMALVDGRLWQASPYVPGIPLDRPGYAFDAWRGAAMAEFLAGLRKASRNMPETLSARPFSILDYIDTLAGQVRTREPWLAERLEPVIAFLKDRLERVHNGLPVAFCHGDYHPLNMIWSEKALKGVIDWEFSGPKPEGYDAATLIGCIGMETPEALEGPLVEMLVRKLRASGTLSEESWLVMAEMTLAIRFGWMAEWLRSRDDEMIELETVYMHLLKDHAEGLSALWCSSRVTAGAI